MHSAQTIELKNFGDSRKTIYHFNFWMLFLIICLFYLGLSFFSNTFVYTSDFYHRVLQGAIDEERINQAFKNRSRLLWAAYVFQPVLLFLKCCIFAAAIYTGGVLFSFKISFGNSLKIVILAEFILFFAMFVKIVYYYLSGNMSPAAFENFSPLSLTQLINLNTIPKYLIYPLTQLNLFELFYWISLAFGVRHFTGGKWLASLKLVAVSYGAVLFTWMLIVVFISIQFS